MRFSSFGISNLARVGAVLKNIIKSATPIIAGSISTKLVQQYIGNFVPVFMLHRLDHPDYGVKGQRADDIRKNLDYFRRNKYKPISLAAIGEHLLAGTQIPYKSAVFTIDDGFIDQYDIAGPLFSEYDIPLTYFLVTDFIDGKLWPWDDQLAYLIDHAVNGEYEIALGSTANKFTLDDCSASRQLVLKAIRNGLKEADNTHIYTIVKDLYRIFSVAFPTVIPSCYRPMTWGQAAALEKAGHHIAAHTLTHRILSRLTNEDAIDEIEGSIAAVGEHIKTQANVFAYPTGRLSDFTHENAASLNALGVSASVSTVSEPFIPGHDLSVFERHSIPRLPMPSSRNNFIQYLSWIEFVNTRIRKNKR
jgi:peptidoglycan/xylan/chitin deacetylase (PgdA/CDA1 family)